MKKLNAFPQGSRRKHEYLTTNWHLPQPTSTLTIIIFRDPSKWSVTLQGISPGGGRVGESRVKLLEVNELKALLFVYVR